MMQPEMPMGRGAVMQPEMPMVRGSMMQPEMPMGRGAMPQSNAPMDSGMVARREVMSGRESAVRPEMPTNSASMNASCDIDQFPVGMAYVPWQRWQQVYPVEKAMNRGTIFPDLDKPFSMGRCR